MVKITNEQLQELKRSAAIELARRNFWHYCNLMAPDFYTEDRSYSVRLCNELQDFWSSDDMVFIVNTPPRHGKSRTACLFVEWLFGQDPTTKIMTGSYNELLSTSFSKSVRNAIQEVKADPNRIVYSDVFPQSRIRKGDGAANLFALEGGHNNYLATSPSGTSTGMGATCFPAGTPILTENGYKNIENVDVGEKVFSFNHTSKIIELKSIIAKREKLSNEFITITTDNGITIRSTVDHQFYTINRGYVRADELTENDYLKTVVPVLWERVQRKKKRKVLFRTMQQFISKNKFLRGLWRICRSDKKGILQREMPGKISFGASEKNNLPGMWESVPSSQSFNSVLWEKMRGCEPWEKNAGGLKSKLQRRSQIHDRLFQNKRACIKSGQLPMSDLWDERDFQEEQALRQSEQFGDSSYKQQYKKEHHEESSHTLPWVPCKITQVEKSQRYPETVFDIQVADNHNFFANDILVHNCLIIDDVIKNSEEAFNEAILDKHWEWFTQTLMSRLEEGGKILLIGTRWATNDLFGRALRHFKEIGAPMRLLTMKALQDDGTMLCPQILSRKTYDIKTKTIGPEIVKANYDQEPMDIQGRLYSSFKTYSKLPKEFDTINNYTDTADLGNDYLCSITYGVYKKEAYILDVIFTKEPMEVTEPKVAAMLHEHKVNVAYIESNNGGRNFARTIERLLKTNHRSNHTRIESFHQSKNKRARILSHATWCQDHIYFPENWADKWRTFYDDLMSYTKEGRHKHDDAEDALTGVAERLGNGGLFSFD